MKSMKGFCPDADTLAGWLEGKLRDPQRAKVVGHLASCDRCRRALGLAAALDPPDVRGRVDERLLGRLVAASRRRPLLRWIAAAGVLAAAGLSLLLLLSERHDPRVVTHAKPEPGVKAVPDTTVPSEDLPSFEPFEEAPAKKAPVSVPPSFPPLRDFPFVLPGGPKPAVEESPEPSSVARSSEETPSVAPPATNASERDDPGGVAKRSVGETVSDPSESSGRVFLNDSEGEIWMRRGGKATARVDYCVSTGPGDSIFTRDKGAGFTFEGKSTIVLEKETRVSLSYFEPDDAYALSVRSGEVFIDTGGTEQRWHFFSGGLSLSFSTLNGRVAVEPRKGRLLAVMLEGWGEVVSGKSKRRAGAGRSIVLGSDGKLAMGSRVGSVIRKKREFYGSLKPKILTVFDADFVGEDSPFPFKVTEGKVVRHADGAYLAAEEIPSVSSYDGEELPPVVRAELNPAKPIVSASGMVMRFRYRTTAERFAVQLGDHSIVYEAPLHAARWTEEEIPLDLFDDEGVEMIPATELGTVAFEAVFPGEGGRLDVDWVRFIRRSR